MRIAQLNISSMNHELQDITFHLYIIGVTKTKQKTGKDMLILSKAAST